MEINRQLELLAIESMLESELKNIFDKYKDVFVDDFYVLHTGNVESGNIVYTMSPSKAEWYWAKNKHLHFGYDLIEEKYLDFKLACKRAGYNMNNDFLYVNAIPFMPTGYGSLDVKVKEELEWIGYTIFDKLKPKFIIIIGFEAAEHLTGMNYLEFISRIGHPFEIESGAKVVVFNENFQSLNKMYYKNYHIERN